MYNKSVFYTVKNASHLTIIIAHKNDSVLKLAGPTNMKYGLVVGAIMSCQLKCRTGFNKHLWTQPLWHYMCCRGQVFYQPPFYCRLKIYKCEIVPRKITFHVFVINKTSQVNEYPWHGKSGWFHETENLRIYSEFALEYVHLT